jgi:hypothetical protein
MRIPPCAGLFLVLLAGLIAGCNPMLKTGNPLVFPTDEDSVLFGISSFAESAIANQDGYPVPGLILNDASLIENAQDLKVSKRRQYAIFQGFFLGNCARGRYWQQQSKKRVGLGLPCMSTRSSKVMLVEVDANHVVIRCKSMRAAHVTLGVDTNDFSKTYKPRPRPPRKV